ncbi:MAG: hypothetical protein U0869_17075 [Chloroflexota bacterium]
MSLASTAAAPAPARPASARRLPIVLAALSAVMAVAGAIMVLANGQPVLGSFNLDLVVVGIVYAAVGGLVASRAPDNRVGWLLLVAALLWSGDLLAAQLAWYGGVVAPGSVPAQGMVAWVSSWLWTPGTVIILFAIPLLFPDGRLPSRRWRVVAAYGLIVVTIDVLGHALAVWPIRDDLAVLQPGFDASLQPGLPGVLASIGDTAEFATLPFLGALALIVRFRRSRGVERLQMRWLTFAVVAAVPAVLLDVLAGTFLPIALGVFSAVALSFIGVAFAVAILRYRLYAIDRVVSRTISYALVTAILALAFWATILVMGQLLDPVTSGSTVGVAASTLVVAALFQPLRRRIQRAVDRRFNRARYDADRIAEAFGDHLRDDVDLGSVAAELQDAVARTLAPRAVGLWVRDGDTVTAARS